MPDLVKSVKRTIDVLELFDRTRRFMSLTEVSDALDLPTSSAQELLRSLVSLGYLSFDRRSRSYRPTLRVAVLGDWIERSLFGEGRYQVLMNELRDLTGESVGIGCESDLDVQFLQILTGTYPLTLNLKAGDKAPLCTSAMGRALLSKRPVKHVQSLLRRHNSAIENPVDNVSWSELESALDFVTHSGYAVSREHTPHGLAGIAMVLPNTPDDSPIVIGVSGPAERIKAQQEKIVSLMVDGLKTHF